MKEGFKIKYRVHAVQRMFERNISENDILEVLKHGQIIHEYPDDNPYPSKLMMGKFADRILHVVVADNLEFNEKIIITVYVPDPIKWEPGFLKKRNQ